MRRFTIVLFLVLVYFLPSLVSAQTTGQPTTQKATSSNEQNSSTIDLQKQIQDLLKQLQVLQAQVAALQGELGAPAQATSTTPTPEVQAATSQATPPELTHSLSRGSSGDDVRKLQEFLAKDKDIYPDGLVTGYFGPLTEKAVKKWQEKHDVESAGIIGPKTIAKFQELGRGVVQGLMNQGAGMSGIIPPGLLTAPGIQKKIDISTTTISKATTTATAATTTIPGTIIPAIPATPAQPIGQTGTTTIPAISAIPATTMIATSTPPQPAHTCGNPINVPAETPSIQAALNAACSGDTVYVSAGTYYESILVPKDNLTLKGAPGTSPQSVIIGSGGVGTFNTGFTIDGFTIQNALNSKISTNAYHTGLYINGSNAASSIASRSINVTARNLIIKNSYYGIGYENDIGTITLEKNLIINNTYAGIASLSGPSPSVNATNNTVANNTSCGFCGGSSSPLLFRNNIFANNKMGVVAGNASLSLFYNDFWNNVSGNFSCSGPGSPPCTFTPSSDTGDPKADPQFVSPTDYHLQSNSPAINAGDPSSQYNDPDGTRNDMGAYPFAGTVSSSGGSAGGTTIAATSTPTTTSIATTTTSDTTPPSTPTGVYVSSPLAGYSSVNLYWNPSTDNVGVTGYKVYQNGIFLINVPSTLTPSVGNLSNSYSYTVAAYDAAGNLSPQSSPVSATTQGSTMSAFTVTPTSLTFTTTVGVNPNQQILTDTNNSSATIAWSRSSSAAWLSTYGSAGTNPPAPYNVGTLPATIDVTGLVAGTYTGTLTFSPQSGYSFPSQMVNVTLTVGGGSIPAPTNLVATTSTTANVNSPLVTLNWTVITQPTNEFKIFRKISGGSWVQAWGGPPNVNNFSEQISFGTYDYKVQACNASSCSSDSNIVTVVVSGPNDTQPPSIPSGLTATAVSPWQVNLSWSSSGDNVAVQGYKIYRNGVFLKTTTNNTEFDNTVSPSTSYSYAVSAYDAAGNISSQSVSVSATAVPATTATSTATSTSAVPSTSALANLLSSLESLAYLLGQLQGLLR